MASVRYRLLKEQSKDGTNPLKMSVSHLGRTALIHLDISLYDNQWDDKLQRVTNHPRKDRINTYLGHLILDAKEFLLDLKRNGRLSSYTTVTELKNAIQEHIFNTPTEETQSTLFLPYFIQCMERKSAGSKRTYQHTLNRITALMRDAETLTFEDITKSWLLDFDTRLELGGAKSRNGRNIHLRNIRAVINNAIDDNLTTNYPFRRMKITNVETVKRSLKVEELRASFYHRAEGYQLLYLDLFKLTFYLIGINAVDLLNADTIDNGRLMYRRQKTHKLYSVKIEPEAMEIINRYKGKKKVLSILEGRESYISFRQRWNKTLKEIGSITYGKHGKKTVTPLHPRITTYWARHSWATIAYSIGVSKDIISQALGHSSGLPVTEVYIERDTHLVDEANRRVMDWVLYDKR